MPADRIRLGILALPFAGMMELATAVLVWSKDTRADEDWAELVVSTRYEAAQLADVLSLVLYLFGAFVIYAYRARTLAERWAMIGLVFVVVCLVSSAVVIAGDASVEPFVGRRYLEGDPGALAIFGEIEEEDALPGLADLTHAWSGYAGFAFFGAAIWRSGMLPQGAVILLAAFAVLTPIAFSVGAGLGFLGYLLMAIAEAWVAWAVWEQLPRAKARPRAR